jgi:hypothetical protein
MGMKREHKKKKKDNRKNMKRSDELRKEFG